MSVVGQRFITPKDNIFEIIGEHGGFYLAVVTTDDYREELIGKGVFDKLLKCGHYKELEE